MAGGAELEEGAVVAGKPLAERGRVIVLLGSGSVAGNAIPVKSVYCEGAEAAGLSQCQ